MSEDRANAAEADEDGGGGDNTRAEVRGLRSDHYLVKKYELDK